MIRAFFLGVVVSTTLLPPQLLSQNPGQNLAVAVQLDSVTTKGDTVSVAMRVTDLVSSAESLFTYMVDAPGGILALPLPAPAEAWDTSNNFRARPMAVWSALDLIPPGTTSPQLFFKAFGVPGIVTYWAEGMYQRETDEDVADSTTEDHMAVHMTTGSTVGVTPWPVDRTPAGLIARLQSLTQSTCNTPLSWITNSALCTQLTNDLDQVEAYRSAGQNTEAKSTLDHFVGLLGSGTPVIYASGVSSSGYWLLVPNALIIKNLL